VVSKTVEAVSETLDLCPSLPDIRDYFTVVTGVENLAVQTFIGFWLVLFPGVGLFSFCLSYERTSNCRGASIGGVIKLGTCFKFSNFLYDSLSQFLEFPFRVVMFTGQVPSQLMWQFSQNNWDKKVSIGFT